jgi:hypothetical protein
MYSKYDMTQVAALYDVVRHGHAGVVDLLMMDAPIYPP